MSWVEAELREQPAALQRFLDAEALNAQEITHRLLRADVRYLLIVSRGSSSNVARYMQYLFGTVNRLPVAFATPSLYTVYDAPPELGPAAVIGISQSGASPDVVAVIGEERAVAATKTYLNSIAAVALLSTAGDPRRLDELLAMPGKVAQQIEDSLAGSESLDRYRDMEGGSVVARGVNYGAAFEIALKIRELSGAQFEAFSSADLLHGPIAALKAGRPAIVIAPSGRTLDSMQVAVDKVRERGAEVVAISDDAEFLEQADTALPLVPGVSEWLSPLLTVVPGQVAAVRLATLRHVDVDSPVGLTKITLTR